MTTDCSVTIRFYEELNDFLDASRRKRDIVLNGNVRRSVKDLIESLGVPHVEVDLILVHGQAVDFSYILQNGDRISVYPMFERLDIGSVTQIPHAPLRKTTFLVDNNLGKLARNLRLLGFDVFHDPKMDDEAIAKNGAEQHRIILTRDRALLKRKIITHGLFVRSTDPTDQILEILRRLDLKGQVAPLSRCLPCGAPLALCSPEEALEDDHIPPCIKASQQTFYRCCACRKIYWRGRHFAEMQRFVAMILEQSAKVS